jgi:hypothetical protein
MAEGKKSKIENLKKISSVFDLMKYSIATMKSRKHEINLGTAPVSSSK